MPDFAQLLQQGTAHAWLFMPSAILLGALHGLEPGHSKTMMAAFIVAVRGTVAQAALLGLAATISHTAVVWAVALGGMHLGRNLDTEVNEPYFQLASAVVIVAIALWMLWRVARAEQVVGRGRAPARHHHHHGGHAHAHTHDHDHRHDRGHASGHDAAPDDHARAHAAEIHRRFAAGSATKGQIVLFGLTGGLIPCPAAITVLLLCLQVKQMALGAALVLCFSIGLAITLVAVGAVAAIGMGRATRRWPGIDALARRAPYLSSALMIAIAAFLGIHAWRQLHAAGAA